MTDKTDLWSINYSDEYVPVRGDTIRYYDLNWRTAVVLNSQDDEVTFLTPENKTRTFNKSNVKVSHDMRMRALSMLDDEDATKNREQFLEQYIANAVKVEKHAMEAKTEAAQKRSNGKVFRMEPDRAQEVSELVSRVTELIEKSDKPVYKNDIVGSINMNPTTYSLVMKKVIGGHKIIKAGKKRGTNYRVAGRTYSE